MLDIFYDRTLKCNLIRATNHTYALFGLGWGVVGRGESGLERIRED